MGGGAEESMDPADADVPRFEIPGARGAGNARTRNLGIWEKSQQVSGIDQSVSIELS